MAVSVTGVGERVMLTLLAKTVGEALATSTDAADVVCQSVMQATVLTVCRTHARPCCAVCKTSTPFFFRHRGPPPETVA